MKCSFRDQELIFEAYQEIISPPQITVTYRPVDGDDKVETYSGPDAKEKAKAFIDDWVGLNGEIGHNANYIVSDDGVGIVAVKGISISDLLGREQLKPEPEEGYAESLGETALKFFSPIISRGCKKWENGGWYYDFKTNDYSIPSPKDPSDVDKIKNEKSWGRPREWRFVYQCSFDEYDGKIGANVSAFYYSGNNQTRVIDKNIYFIPSTREDDLEKAESVLALVPKELVEFIENNIREQGLKIN